MEASADNSSPKAHPNWLRRHVVAISVVLVLLLLYTLGGFLLVPYVARTQAIAYVQKNMQRQLSIGDLKFNPFLLRVEIHDLKLNEADGAAIASLLLLRIEFNAMASLVHRAWTLGEVRLEQPFINVLLDHSGALNLAKLVPPAKEPQPPPRKSQGLPRVRVGLFSVQQGRVHFEDHSRGEPAFAATLTPIEFDLTDFRTQPDFENKYRFSASSAAGERFDWAGQFDVQPLSSNGEFSVSGLRAGTIASYLENSLPCALNSGTLDMKGQYQFVAQGAAGPAISVTLPSVQVHTLTISPKGAETGAMPWISLPELDVKDTKVVLNDHTAAVGEILLTRPAVQVWREADGTLNLQRLAGTPAAPNLTAAATTAPPAQVSTAVATASTPAAATPAWKVTLAKFAIAGADIQAEDRSVKPALKLRVSPLNLTVQNASSEGTQPLSYDLEATVAESGKLHTAGKATLTPLAAQVSVDVKALDLSLLQPYIAQQADVALYHGAASTDLKIDYAAKPAKGQPQLKVTGAAEVVEFATRDGVTNADFISWSALGATGVKYQMNPSSVDIERVYAKGLYSRVVISQNGTINIKDVMQAPGTSPPAAAAPAPQAKAAPKKSSKASTADAKTAAAAPMMPLRIKRIDIEDSTADFTDHSIEPSFSAGITGLHGSIVGLSSAASARAKITLDGSVGDFAPVQIRGAINPFAAIGYTDLSMSFHNMELTTFNPYSGKYAGYSIDQGKLSTDLHYHIENRKLDATHHIVIDQLQFGAATESKQAAPLPIKLAVAILKDRNGVITLDLPEITGTIDDPKFKIGPLIWTLVLDLMKKVVEAPFAAIGAMFGGGHELSYVDFEPGSSTLREAAGPKLAKLSSALVEKPQLKLDVPLHAITDLDNTALSKAALDQAVNGAASDSKRAPKGNAGASPDQTARLTALLAIYRQKLAKEPEYPGEQNGKAQNPNDPNATPAGHIAWLEQQLLPQFKASADELNALGKARAEAVQSALLANKDLQPERVFLTERTSTGIEDGLAHMELKLE
jgi:hypothetical protein